MTPTLPSPQTSAGTSRDAPAGPQTHYRICPLCEACCGLEIRTQGLRVTRIQGWQTDVLSAGYLCPKAVALKDLHEDPDRLRTPLMRRNGRNSPLEPASWDEALALIAQRLPAITAAHGRDALALVAGNPSAHKMGLLLYFARLARAAGSKNLFSASTVDQRPKELANAWLYGGGLTVAVPDLDRTDYLLILGANPYASNGSLATAPDWPGRIEAIRARGGRLVVVDPRRSRTAEEADWHLAIRPGTDALLLAAVVTSISEAGRIDTGPAGDWLMGLSETLVALAPFTAEAVAPTVGIDAADIRQLAMELADAPTAAVYGRIGTTTAEFGTLASWLVDVVNIVTGNLDQPGGVMFPKAAAGSANTRGASRVGRALRTGRHHSRVRGLAETLGELPVVCLAEEIDTAGEGQVRALFTVAGNPVLSTPNSARLDAALATLDCYVAVDIYLNETTRHAHVVLPPPSAFEKDHYDLAFNQLAIRNVANWSPAALAAADDQPQEWEILARLALIAQGFGADSDPSLVDDLVVGALLTSAVSDEHGPVHGRDPAELLAALGERRGPARLVDLLLRTGPYGDGFGSRTDEVVPGVPPLTLAVLEARPHGVDLGSLEPRLPEVLRTPSGMVEMAAEPFLSDLPRLAAALERPAADLVLVGRRDLRSNNSWMHNVEVLVKGKVRCTLHVNPVDAARFGLVDGGVACLSGRVGSLEAPVEITDAIRPGVVSLPHGWGHDADGVRLGVAGRYAGVNANLVADELLVDELSGNAVLNGIPVSLAPC